VYGHATFPAAEKGAYSADALKQYCETVRSPLTVHADKDSISHELNSI
jgi:hypothetical protein